MAAVTGLGRADRLAARAEAELYERHSDRVFGFCLSRLGRREDAEDATQLTFLHAVRGLRRGVVPAAESAWLFGIARNVCLSRWASAGRRGRVEAACDPSDLERLAQAHDPRRDELIGLESALGQLPEQQRRAVLLRDWRGLSYAEIADRLGVSHAAVETLIFRGRAALAEHLGEQESAPRRRDRALGGLWALLDAVKGAFGGAATGAKLAAAVGAAIAVSGGVIALGTASTREPAAKPVAAERQRAQLAAGEARVDAEATKGPARASQGRGTAQPGEARGRSSSATAAASSEVSPAAAAASDPVRPADGAGVDPVAAAPAGESAVAEQRGAGAQPSAAAPTAAAGPSVPTSPDEVVATTEPVTAVVSEALAAAALPALPAAALPELPAAELPKVEAPKLEVPKVEVPKVEVPPAATPAPAPAVPPLPTAPAVPSLP